MTFNDIRNDVRNFYERNKDVFTRPSVEDCIDYAITEGAEALDALLRIKRSKDVRRTSKEIDFDAEVGDMKFMMVACVLDDPDEWWDYLPEYMQGKVNDRQDVLNALSQLCTNQPKSAILFMSWDLYAQCDNLYGTMKKLEGRCAEMRKNVIASD